MKQRQWLLHPEWQGAGNHPEIQESVERLAAELFPNREFWRVDCSAAEVLREVDGVLGLDGIAGRFQNTLGFLRRRQPDSIVVMGGSCGVDAAPVAYLSERYGEDLGVLWFDSHADLNTPTTSPSGHFHGMVLRSLLGDGPDVVVREIVRPLSPTQVVLIGTQSLDVEEARYIRTQDIAVVRREQLNSLADVIRSHGYQYVHLHIDLDVLADETLRLSPFSAGGGIHGPALEGALRAIATENQVVGVSIVEYYWYDARSREAVRRVGAAAGLPV